MQCSYFKYLVLTIVVNCLSFSASAQEQEPISLSQPAAESTPFDWIPDDGIPGLPAFTVTTNDDGSEDYSVTIQILAILTALTLIPAL